MDLTVIIPTCNRSFLLEKALKSLLNQTLSRLCFEVIVVDNGPSDKAAKVTSEFKSDIKNLRYLVENRPGLHNARHRGMIEASSEILAFIDDDSEVGSDWVTALVQAFDNPGVALAGGNNYPGFEIAPPEWLLRWWQRPVYKGRALGYLSILDFGEGSFEIDPAYVWGCNFAIRKELLEKSGGFHPDAFPRELVRFRGDGETHLSDSIRGSGLQTIFDSRASVHHFVPKERMTKAYFAQRAYDQGISDSFAEMRTGLCCGVSVRRRIDWLHSLVRVFARKLMVAGDPVECELLAVQRATVLAHSKGYHFHRHAILSDPLLMEWVLKKDYMQ